MAILLFAPSLVIGTLTSHDSWLIGSWATQFSSLFRAGVLYPRWLPQSFDNLGAPTFYYTPPLAYWLDALVSAASANLLPDRYRLSVSGVLLLSASGLAIHGWLKTVTSPRAALYGALAYMAAPYHLIDHYVRGAYSEFAAYAVLPLVVLAVRQVAERRRFGFVFLAMAYAALSLVHLPTALLVSLTVLPMYVLYRGWQLGEVRQARGFFVRCALGSVLGLGLAAIYLIPAVALQGWINSDHLWGHEHFRIETWFILTLLLQDRLFEHHFMVIVAYAALAFGIAAVGVLTMVARTGVPQGWRSEAAFWAFVCLVCLLFVAGAVPWFWQLPLVDSVQFPFRLMTVVEFAAITALSLAPWPGRSRIASALFVVAVIVLVPAGLDLGRLAWRQIEQTMTEPDSVGDTEEFLPAGYGRNEYLPEQLRVPTISCTPTPRVCRAVEEPFGGLRIEVEGDAPATVVLRRFFFPAWRLDPAQPIGAADPLRLVSFTA
ncbi:MAG TPA: hypothetical protein VK777_04880, partial [Reyranella sp.]|nr:hypothetical protein [Reyranella sp.]